MGVSGGFWVPRGGRRTGQEEGKVGFAGFITEAADDQMAGRITGQTRRCAGTLVQCCMSP